MVASKSRLVVQLMYEKGKKNYKKLKKKELKKWNKKRLQKIKEFKKRTASLRDEWIDTSVDHTKSFLLLRK